VRKAVERHRKGITGQGITQENVNPDVILHRPNGADYNPNELLPDGRKRYLGPFSDGQVLDRLTVPGPNKHIPEMIACNRVNKTRLGKGTDKERAAKLLMICRSLDKETRGLDNKKENLLDLVRYGRPTMREVYSKLT